MRDQNGRVTEIIGKLEYFDFYTDNDSVKWMIYR